LDCPFDVNRAGFDVSIKAVLPVSSSVKDSTAEYVVYVLAPLNLLYALKGVSLMSDLSKFLKIPAIVYKYVGKKKPSRFGGSVLECYSKRG